MNPFVKSIITAELFLWGGWNAVMPLFSVFVIKGLPGSNLAIATSGYSVHLIVKILFEMVAARFFSKGQINSKLYIILFGQLIVCMSYLGFAFFKTVFAVYFFYALAGAGFGLSVPTKLGLFSKKIDKDKETFEFGLMDSVTTLGTAAAAILGGLVVHVYGFQTMFALAAVISFAGMFPYILLIEGKKSKKRR